MIRVMEECIGEWEVGGRISVDWLSFVARAVVAVSYTHLTLPTIYSV